MKKILFLLFCCSFFHMGNTQSPNFNLCWSETHTLNENIDYGVYGPFHYNGNVYFQYETIVQQSTFEIDGKHPITSFYRLNIDNLKLESVNDEKILAHLADLNKTDEKYNNYFNDKWIYDPYDLTPKKAIEEHTVELYCVYDGTKYVHTIQFKNREGPFLEHISDFLIDESKLRGVFYVDCGIGNVFMKFYFLEFDLKTKKLSVIEKDMTYEELGFKKEDINFIRTYNERSNYNDKYMITLFFNVENSKKLGISNIIFDFTNSDYHINSEAFEDSTLLPEFNDLSFGTRLIEDEIHYFISTDRPEISSGELKSTQLGPGNGEHLIHLISKNGEFIYKTYKGAENNLEYYFLDRERLVLIYSGKTNFEDYSIKIDNSGDEIIKYSIVDINQNDTTLYVETLIKDSDWVDELDFITFHIDGNQKLSEEITIYVNYFKDYPQTELDRQYRMGTIKIKLPD